MNEIAINTQNGGAEITPSRRRFVASALAAALGISLADVMGPGELIAAPAPGCSTSGEAFVPVGEIVSKNNKLAATMTVKSIEKTIATIADAGYQCRTMKVRYYEGVDLNNPSMKWPVNANGARARTDSAPESRRPGLCPPCQCDQPGALGQHLRH